MEVTNLHSDVFQHVFSKKYGILFDEELPRSSKQNSSPDKNYGVFMNETNLLLIIGGVLSFLAALLHIGIIIGGASWYRFFGAGEKMATMAETGSWYPTVVTLIITVVLFIWGLYAFSGAGLIRTLPLLKIGLVVISVIYLTRGLAFIPALLIMPDKVDAFIVWSSLISLVFGLCYAIGTQKIW